mgnify:CR=1 FL=1
MPIEVSQPSDREVRVTRTFNAPRQLVWDAHTKPELVRKWQGYDGWDMPVCDMDVRVGGKYKWQWRSREDGKQFGFFGTFTEVNGPSKLVHEEYYDPGDIGGAMPAGDPCIVSLELSEQNGVTTPSSAAAAPALGGKGATAPDCDGGCTMPCDRP